MHTQDCPFCNDSGKIDDFGDRWNCQHCNADCETCGEPKRFCECPELSACCSVEFNADIRICPACKEHC